MVSRLSPLHRNLALGFLALLAFAVAYSWLSPRPKPATRTETREKTVTHTREQEEMQRKLDERQRIIDELRLREQQRSHRDTNLNTRVVERITRYPSAPPSSSPAPVVVVRDGAPQPAPAAIPPQPVEVIVRTTETVDRSQERSERNSDTERRTDTETGRSEVEESRRTTDSRTETEKKTVTETKGAGESAPRLGVGVLTGQSGSPAPFASYDFVNKPLGPKVLGLNKIRLGLGVFGTRGQDGSLDGGPQANVGKGSVFLMGGYRVKTQDPVIGVGLKFRF